MVQSSVTPIRAGTKALPEKVFDACDQLAESKGEFRNEDVLAITGGGMATVGRLVRTWRQHQHIIEANESLSAEATITLVEMVDKLVQRQIARSTEAVDTFMSTTAQDMTDLSQTLDARDAALRETKEDARALRDQLKARDEQLTQVQTRLADRDRALADALARADRLEAEVKQAQTTHLAKLEQVHSEHQHRLAQSLETQRHSMDEARSTALRDQREEWEDRLADAQLATTHAETAVEAERAIVQNTRNEAHSHELRIRELEAEISALHRLHKTQLAKQTAIIDAKQDALDEAQRAQQALTTTIDQQLSTVNAGVDARLTALAGAASGVTTALADIDALLKEIRSATGAGNPTPKDPS